mgnify:CR=1 FL=1
MSTLYKANDSSPGAGLGNNLTKTLAVIYSY